MVVELQGEVGRYKFALYGRQKIEEGYDTNFKVSEWNW